MKRTKLSERQLPAYTKGEERMNALTHGLGVLFGIFVLAVCLFRAKDAWGVVSSAIYGGSMILLYAVSTVYHALRPNMGKQVMRVLDHCSIYFLIAGTYTPILLSAIRPIYPGWAWTIFGIVWGCAVLGTVFTAIDLKKYGSFSMTCYICMGWCIVMILKPAIASIPLLGLLWILAGGVAYTVGAVLYGLGKKHRYIHSVFHLFVLMGTALQFVAIVKYIL